MVDRAESSMEQRTIWGGSLINPPNFSVDTFACRNLSMRREWRDFLFVKNCCYEKVRESKLKLGKRAWFWLHFSRHIPRASLEPADVSERQLLRNSTLGILRMRPTTSRLVPQRRRSRQSRTGFHFLKRATTEHGHEVTSWKILTPRYIMDCVA